MISWVPSLMPGWLNHHAESESFDFLTRGRWRRTQANQAPETKLELCRYVIPWLSPAAG